MTSGVTRIKSQWASVSAKGYTVGFALAFRLGADQPKYFWNSPLDHLVSSKLPFSRRVTAMSLA